MSNMLPTKPRNMTQRRSFAIVASQYNAEYVNGLVEHAKKELADICPGGSMVIYEVPGAFEIPLLVQEVAERGGVDAIIAFGVIIEGETLHANHIGHTVSQTLMRLGLRFRIPIVHEVLLVSNEAQAKARCLDEELNRGVEAARTAVRMAGLFSELKHRGTHG